MYALDGINVLSLESGISAPLCTRMLGDLGAEVVKVERPGVGDVNRHWDSDVRGHSSAHVWVDRNKQSIELNLKSEPGRGIFLELAESADVVVQNYSPGVVDRLGIDYADIREINESVIYLNISGYGLDGPYRDRKAYDMVMQGETGLILMNGLPDAPAKIPLSICDINAAMYGAMGILTALFTRERTGEGREISVSMFAGMLSWLGYFPQKYWYADTLPERVGMRHHLLSPYGPHETSDGQYVNFAILSQAHWETFCNDIIDRPGWIEHEDFGTNEQRINNRTEFEPLLEAIIRDRPRDYWAERFEANAIPWGDVNQLDAVLEHPQTQHLDAIREFETSEGPVKFIDNPLDISGFDLRRDKMPGLGEHTEEILRSLGYSAAEISDFRDDDVV